MEIFKNLSESFKENLENSVEKTKSNIDTKGSNLSSDEVEVAQKLNAVEEFTIDRFEGDMVLLENRNTREMLEINKQELPRNIKEGDILDKINGKYIVNSEKTLETKEKIKDKMKRLWNN